MFRALLCPSSRKPECLRLHVVFACNTVKKIVRCGVVVVLSCDHSRGLCVHAQNPTMITTEILEIVPSEKYVCYLPTGFNIPVSLQLPARHKQLSIPTLGNLGAIDAVAICIIKA